MTETRLNEGFTAYPAHRQMTPEDAVIFDRAAEMLVESEVSKAISDAGGDEAHKAHFGREVCPHIPIQAWADRQDAEVVAKALRGVAERLREAGQ